MIKKEGWGEDDKEKKLNSKEPILRMLETQLNMSKRSPHQAHYPNAQETKRGGTFSSWHSRGIGNTRKINQHAEQNRAEGQLIFLLAFTWH